MYLQDIAPGQRVFIDANIFVYHFSKDSGFNKSCRDFLLKVESSEIHGFTSAAVILEATHRLMMVEATSIIESDVKNLPKYLKQNPDIAKKLTKHLAVPGKIASLNIEIVPVTLKAVEESQSFKTEYGFLSNDSRIKSGLKRALKGKGHLTWFRGVLEAFGKATSCLFSLSSDMDSVLIQASTSGVSIS